MTSVPEILINDIKVSKLSDSPLGSLLQIANSQNEPSVVLRCQLPVAGGTSLGVVYLEGAQAGLFFTDAELSYYEALDVNHLASVVLIDPAPRRPGDRPPAAGIVCQVTDMQDAPFVALSVALANSPAAIVGYACLSGPRAGDIEKSKAPVFQIGRGAVVPRERE